MPARYARVANRWKEAVEILPAVPRDTRIAAIGTPIRDRIAAAWLLARKREHTEAAYRRDIAGFFDWCDEFDIDPLTARRGGYSRVGRSPADLRSYTLSRQRS